MRIPILRAVVACALTVAFVSFAFAQRGPQQPPMIKEGVTEKISEHVYVIPDGNVGMVPNVSIIVGTTGTFVVDTGLGARNGQAVMREVDKVSRTADLYLATTHFHPEHDLGAHGFPPRTKMIRSRDQLAELQESGLETAKRFAGFSPASGKPGDTVTLSGTSLQGTTVVSIGGQAALNVVVVNGSSVTAVVGPNAVTGPVSLTTPGGTAVAPGVFTILSTSAPTISDFGPTTGGAGAVIRIMGTGFAGALARRRSSAVCFGESSIAIGTFTKSGSP